MKEISENIKAHRRLLIVECEDMIQRLNIVVARARAGAIFPHSILDTSGKIESHLRIIQALEELDIHYAGKNPLDGKN